MRLNEIFSLSPVVSCRLHPCYSRAMLSPTLRAVKGGHRGRGKSLIQIGVYAASQKSKGFLRSPRDIPKLLISEGVYKSVLPGAIFFRI